MLRTCIATRLTFLVFLLLCVRVDMLAQETRFGIKAGPSYSSIVGELTDGIKFRFSGHAGVFLHIEFSEKFAFQPEVVYSSQGFQFSSDLFSIDNTNPVDGNDFRTNVQLNYFTVPLLGNFTLGESYVLQFGPQFGFLLNQVIKNKNLDERDGADATSRLTTSGNFQLDYGLAAGIDIKLNEQFSLAPRLYLGLRDRLNGAEGTAQNFNVAIQLSLNYLFY